MSPVATIIRFAQLDHRRRAVLSEALLNLVRAKAAIRLLPFRIAVLQGAAPLGGARGTATVAELVDGIEAVAGRLPWRSVCFDRGLALQRTLRRRGHDARLHYGLSTPAGGTFGAHVWVELDGLIVIGADEARGHQSVAVFPR